MDAKLNIEQIKKAKDGLDVIRDIEAYAKSGFATIAPEDFALFKWYGLYQQRPNEGHFMQRVKVPNGTLYAHQLRALGGVAKEFGRNLVDITTRQTFQFHWFTIEDIPEIYRRFREVGLGSTGACGDIARNIVGCPLAGIAADELFDVHALVQELAQFMVRDKSFSNMPRKYKISLSACPVHCAQPQINDCAFYGIRREVEGRVETGFGVLVGGGLSTKPYFGADLGVFVPVEQIREVLVAVSEIYRDAPELRQDRGRARLKFLVHDPKFGIGAEAFRSRVEEKIGARLPDAPAVVWPRHAEGDHLGIARQKQDGFWYAGIGVRAGRLTGDKLIQIAEVAEEFSAERMIRNTNKQNFIITHIPEEKLEDLKARLDELELDYRPSVFKKSLISCTGIEFCNLAVTETKELGRRVSRELEERFPSATRPVRIHFSGCPNNCGQNAIADIGLRGMLTKVDGQLVHAFDILVGGTTGADKAFSEVCTKRFPADRIGWAIGNLYEAFLNWADNEQTFHDYVRAHTLQELDAVAKGAVVVVG